VGDGRQPAYCGSYPGGVVGFIAARRMVNVERMLSLTGRICMKRCCTGRSRETQSDCPVWVAVDLLHLCLSRWADPSKTRGWTRSWRSEGGTFQITECREHGGLR
jgi:hypothetical protein